MNRTTSSFGLATTVLPETEQLTEVLGSELRAVGLGAHVSCLRMQTFREAEVAPPHGVAVPRTDVPQLRLARAAASGAQSDAVVP